MDTVLLKEWEMASVIPRAAASLSEKFHFAVRCAVLAPSSHNSQPWLFRVEAERLLLMMDRRRALSVVDPHDRELIMSCGAALFNIRVALARCGVNVRIEVLPDPFESDLLAEVMVEPGALSEAAKAIAPLVEAIPRRMTNRSIYPDDGVPVGLLTKLEAATQIECAHLAVATTTEARTAVATLVAAADRVQFDNVHFRHELASWLHPMRTRDGLSAFSSELAKTLDFATPLAALVVRTFDVGGGVAAKNLTLAKGSPMLVCISTATDDAPAWLVAGQALQRLLLVAASEGYSASYLNQPIEVTTLRSALSELMRTETFPQLLLRLGHGLPQTHAPRRSLDEVLLSPCDTHPRSARF